MLLGLSDAGRQGLASASGGMKQRLALALALIGTPRRSGLDEPTANLDAHGRAELAGIIPADQGRMDSTTFSVRTDPRSDRVAMRCC